MKYLTPQLLAECRVADDDVAEQAAARWEKALAAYQARLADIRAELPTGARRLLKQVSLHDAQWLTIQTAEGPRGKELFLTFRLAGGGGGKAAGGVELRYRLCGRSAVALQRESGNGVAVPFVLYDEFDLDARRGKKVFTHSLLLTGGLELRIRFSKLRLQRFGKIALAHSTAAEMEKDWAGDDLLAPT